MGYDALWELQDPTVFSCAVAAVAHALTLILNQVDQVQAQSPPQLELDLALLALGLALLVLLVDLSVRRANSAE